MADKDLTQNQSLSRSDQVRYVEIASGVYAPVVATTPAGTSPASAALTFAETTVNVNGDTAILAANTNRRYLLLINDSDTVIYVTSTGTAAANAGIRINASGGSYELTGGTGVYTGALRANHGGGAVDKRLLIVEGT